MPRSLLILFAVFTCFITGAFAQDTPAEHLLDIQEVTSDDGITAWLLEDHSIPVIAMDFAFQGAGSVNDPDDKQGLAQLLSNTLDEGAGDIKSTAFQKTLQDLSISLSFSSGRDNFGGSVKTLTKNSDTAFDLLKLALTEPRFDPEPVERMRKANQSRIRSSLSEPSWIAARLQNDFVFAGHPYARNSGGTLSSLETITPDDLRKFHTSFLGKNNLIIAVAGDMDAKTLKAKLDEIFGALPDVDVPSPPTLTLQNQGGVAVYYKDVPQTVIRIMQPGIKRTDPDFHAAQVMNFVLGSSGFGSRLTEEIREKRGLTYGIYSSLYNLDHMESLAVSTSTQTQNVPQMLSLIEKEFSKMKRGGITQQELDDAKAYLLGSLPLSLTSTDKISGLMLSLLSDGLPIDYLDQRAQSIRDMTREDIKSVSKRLLDPEHFVTVAVGDLAEDGQVRKKLNKFGSVVTFETLPNVE